MKISLLTDLQISDAGIVRNVKPLLEKLVIQDPDVILDFCNCGVDYPATSLIIDKVLFDLKLLEGNKKLQILFDFKIHDFAIHKWFFIGSNFFEIKEDDNHLTFAELKQLIENKLIAEGIVLEILIINDDETPFNSVKYGTN
ncbi:MAG: hypothetical protein ABIU77_18045 [Ferruginibacter sp.]